MRFSTLFPDIEMAAYMKQESEDMINSSLNSLHNPQIMEKYLRKERAAMVQEQMRKLKLERKRNFRTAVLAAETSTPQLSLSRSFTSSRGYSTFARGFGLGRPVDEGDEIENNDFIYESWLPKMDDLESQEYRFNREIIEEDEERDVKK
jgi:hypothetical protein